jgi:hypothetical protein
MKNRSPILMGALAILAGSAMLVSAVALSNILVYTNEVQGIAITSTWASGPKNIGQEYAFNVNYVSPAGTPSAVLMFEFDRIGIVSANVTLAYWTGTAWVNTTFSSNGPDAIVGSTMTIVAGPTSGGFKYELTYNAIGTYTMKIWAG